MNEMTTTQAGRDLTIVTSEIKFYKRQTEIAVLAGAIEIGRRLVEAKAMVGHGNWGAYLKEEVNFSQSTANNMMRLYEEYGDDQATLFGNSQSFMNLDPTKALKLLQIPEEEREAFVTENDVENKSVRELDELIRQRDEALKKAGDMENKAVYLESELKIAKDTIDQQSVDIGALEKTVSQKRSEVDKLKEQLDTTNELLSNRKKEIEDIKKNPSISEDMMEQLRREAESTAGANAAQEAAKRFEAKLAKAEKSLKVAQEKLEEAKRQAQEEKATADAALKQLRLANPDAAIFKTLFEQAQDSFNRLLGSFYKIQAADPDLGANCKNAISAMLDQLKKAVEQK